MASSAASQQLDFAPLEGVPSGERRGSDGWQPAAAATRATQSLAASLRLARALLDEVDSLFAAAAGRVAALCARNGRLDASLLDEHQWSSYELALADADLIAAKTLVSVGPNASDLDAALGLAFTTEAIVAILTRLQGVYLATGLDTNALYRFLGTEDLQLLRKELVSPEILAEVGRAVADANGEVADVVVDEQTALARDAFRRFAADVVAPMAEEIHRRNLTVPESLLKRMRELGVFGLSIPEAYGGSSPDGRNTPMMIAVTEALSEASLGAAGSLITRPEILARALLLGGTEGQKAQWLPRIAAGESLCAIAITEPDYGSDVANLALRGTRTDGGWLLNGAKTWCTFAGKAGVVMVVARTAPDRSVGYRGLSLLLVEKPSYDGHEFSYTQPGGGTLQGRAIATIGYRGMHSFDLAFENFYVPDANVVGGPAGLGKGFLFTMSGMIGGRVQTAGRALGVMKAAMKAAIAHAKDRQVFGASLMSFQLTRIKVAMMAARFTACRHLAYAVGRQVDEGGGRMEASLVKLLACRSAEMVTRESLQIHGGMGYAEESAVSRYSVDARVLSIFEGAEETLALKVVARTLLEAALAKQATST